MAGHYKIPLRVTQVRVLIDMPCTEDRATGSYAELYYAKDVLDGEHSAWNAAKM